MVRDGLLHVVDDDAKAFFRFDDFYWFFSAPDLGGGPSFVDEIDRLAWEMAMWKEHFGTCDRSGGSFVDVGYSVKVLVDVLDAAQHVCRIRFSPGMNVDWLKAIFEPTMIGDGLGVAGGSGHADALKLATDDGSFQDLLQMARVSAEDTVDWRVQFVNDEDRSRLRGSWESAVELVEPGAADGVPGRKVEFKDSFLDKERRHIAF